MADVNRTAAMVQSKPPAETVRCEHCHALTTEWQDITYQRLWQVGMEVTDRSKVLFCTVRSPNRDAIKMYLRLICCPRIMYEGVL